VADKTHFNLLLCEQLLQFIAFPLCHVRPHPLFQSDSLTTPNLSFLGTTTNLTKRQVRRHLKCNIYRDLTVVAWLCPTTKCRAHGWCFYEHSKEWYKLSFCPSSFWFYQLFMELCVLSQLSNSSNPMASCAHHCLLPNVRIWTSILPNYLPLAIYAR
jgi:hypothetical protein